MEVAAPAIRLLADVAFLGRLNYSRKFGLPQHSNYLLVGNWPFCIASFHFVKSHHFKRNCSEEVWQVSSLLDFPKSAQSNSR